MPAELLAVHPVLMARDVAASIEFFKRLGFALIFQDDPKNVRYAAVQRDSVELHLQWADADQWTHHGDRPAYRFLVSDVDALYGEFINNGGVIPGTSGSPWASPADTPWGCREFHVRDPGGNGLQFYQPIAAGGNPN